MLYPYVKRLNESTITDLSYGISQAEESAACEGLGGDRVSL